MATLMPGGKQTYFDNAGDPLVGGLLYTYAAGTSTPLATYSNQAGTIPNTNPVVLNARGEATVFWGAASYKVSLRDSADVPIWTQDDVDPTKLVDGYAPLASPAFTGTPTGLSPTPITATGSTTARTLAARFADTINVKDHGAKGDGVTDDTAAIRAAITVGNLSGADVVRLFFPYSKDPYLTQDISLTDSDKQVIFEGDSKQGSRLRITSSATGYGIKFGATDNSWSGLRNIRVETLNTLSLTAVVYVNAPNNGFVLDNALLSGAQTITTTPHASYAVEIVGGSYFEANQVYTTSIGTANYYFHGQTTNMLASIRGGNNDVATTNFIKIESSYTGPTLTVTGVRLEGAASKDLISLACTSTPTVYVDGCYVTNGSFNSVIKKLAGYAAPWYSVLIGSQDLPVNLYVDGADAANNIAWSSKFTQVAATSYVTPPASFPAYGPPSSPYSITAADKGYILSNRNSSNITFNLPSIATVGDGWWVVLYANVNGTITVDPAGSDAIDTGSGGANVHNSTAAQGDLLYLVSFPGPRWMVLSKIGTWIP